MSMDANRIAYLMVLLFAMAMALLSAGLATVRLGVLEGGWLLTGAKVFFLFDFCCNYPHLMVLWFLHGGGDGKWGECKNTIDRP